MVWFGGLGAIGSFMLSILAVLATKHGVRLRDVRRTPPRKELHALSGKIEQVTSLKVAVLGTDSVVGKRTTAWILAEALEAVGYTAELIGTGQTAWMRGVHYGVILDSLINDFVAGEIEHAVWSAWKEVGPDVIIIEGQGSLMNPAYPGGFEILAAGRPDVVILQHAPRRKEYEVSCHAAHKEGDRIHPCGRCEKCRRIVGIMMALGADPTKCGYTHEQIEKCLRTLADKGIHQETEGAEHLTFLLKKKGLISRSTVGSARARERAEVMKVRFDPQKSPIDGIPLDLRQPIYRIYLTHAAGAVKRSGRLWIDFDPLTNATMKRPYPFETPQDASFSSGYTGQERAGRKIKTCGIP